MENIAIIDIGSNSMRLVLFHIFPEGSYKVFNELQETVRLGQDVNKTGLLREDKMEEALETLMIFKKMCRAIGVTETIAVATAAVRKAKNGKAFVQRLQKETGIGIRILSGEEEAFYAYFGVVNSIEFPEALIVDLGGGSTEIVLVRDKQVVNCCSLPYGAIDFTDEFNLSDAVKQSRLNAFSLFFQSELELRPWIKDAARRPLIGVGGTIRNIGKIDRSRKRYPLEIAHNYKLTNQDLSSVFEAVKSVNLSKRKRIKGLSKSRADIFVGAMAAIRELIAFSGTRGMIVSGSGIREGLIHEYIQHNHQPSASVLRYSIDSFMTRLNMDKPHAEYINRLTEGMFEALRPVHGLSGDLKRVLMTAALLHDSGIDIRFYNHNDHSFYMILNSGLKGLDHRELVMSALTASMHRSKKSKIKASPYKKLLAKKDFHDIEVLSAFLRLAESLDITLNRIVRDMDITVTESTIRMVLKTCSDASVELRHAQSSLPYFKRLFGRRLVLEQQCQK